MRAFLLVLTGIAIAGCSKGGRDAGTDQMGDLVRLHADILIFDQRASLAHTDSATIARGKDSLFRHAGIARNEYERAIAAYKGDLDVWKDFNVKTIARLEEIQKARAVPKDSATISRAK